MDRNIAIVGLIVGFAGLFLAYAGLSQEVLAEIPSINGYRNLLLYAGLVFSIFSLPFMVMIALEITKTTYNIAMIYAKGRKTRISDKYFMTFVAKDQLSLAYSMIKDSLKKEGVNNIFSLEKFTELWEKNNQVYMIIWDCRKSNDLRLVGFVNAYPITLDCAKLLISGELRGGDFQKKHICRSRDVTYAYFIGAIAGIKLSGRASVVSLVDRKMAEITTSKHNIQMFTVPYTVRGRAIARKYDFHPIYKYSDAELWLKTTFSASDQHLSMSSDSPLTGESS